MSERRSTALILVDELHYLALEEKLKLIQSPPKPNVLDRLPIIRITGQTTKGTDESDEVETRPWETEEIKSYHRHNYNYHFFNPKHAAFDIQKQSAHYIENDYPKVPIEYLEIQVDIFSGEPEADDKYIYRFGFLKQKLPKTSDTCKSALSRIERYRKDYDLYKTTKEHSENHIKMWLGALYCLELKRILRGPKEAKNAYWRKPRNITKEYLEVDAEQSEDFFRLLMLKTNNVVEWAYKIYNPDEIGWQLDGLYRG